MNNSLLPLLLLSTVALAGCTIGEDTSEENPYWSFDLYSEYPKELWFEARVTKERPEPGRHESPVQPNTEWGGITYGCTPEAGVFYEVRFVEVHTEEVVAHDSWELECDHYELLIHADGELSLTQEKEKESPPPGIAAIVVLVLVVAGARRR